MYVQVCACIRCVCVCVCTPYVHVSLCVHMSVCVYLYVCFVTKERERGNKSLTLTVMLHFRSATFPCYNPIEIILINSSICSSNIYNRISQIKLLWVLDISLRTFHQSQIAFRHICLADFAYSQNSSPSICVYVCKCVCMSAFCVNVCSQVDSILKTWTILILTFQSNGGSPVLLLVDHNFHFQGQNVIVFLVLRISRKRWEMEQKLILSLNRKSSICHRMAPLRMWYFLNVVYILTVTNSWN